MGRPRYREIMLSETERKSLMECARLAGPPTPRHRDCRPGRCSSTDGTPSINTNYGATKWGTCGEISPALTVRLRWLRKRPLACLVLSWRGVGTGAADPLQQFLIELPHDLLFASLV